MSSNRKKNNKKNNNNKNINNLNADNKIDDDLEECDKLLEQLDKLEQEREDISSKVKNLIKSDKEAIKKMQEEISKLDDDLDYLDDEKTNDDTGEKDSDKQSEDIDNNTDTATDSLKSTDKRTVNGKKKNKKRNISREEKAENTENRAETDKKTDERNSNGKESVNNEDSNEVKLDFFSNYGTGNKKDYNRIRKQQPNRLRDSKYNSGNDRLKNIFLNSRKNLFSGIAVVILLVALIVALVLDKGNVKEENKNSISTEFMKIDTAPMIDTINDYYAALAGDDVNQVRTYLMDNEQVSDEEIEKKSEETKVYGELISSSFLITDCYVQQGLKSNEYIAYMKFQLQIKSIETPAVGIFTCYFVDNSTDGKADYKISINVTDTTSEVYRHMAKMSNSSNVKELFSNVDKELKEACEKDANLKAVVDALENPEQAGQQETTPIDDSTTSPMENDN